MSERYIVRESSPGYRIDPAATGLPAGNRIPPAEIMVLDRFYCYRVVWSSWSSRTWGYWYSQRGYRQRSARPYRWPLPQQRAYAEDLARRLNADAR